MKNVLRAFGFGIVLSVAAATVAAPSALAGQPCPKGFDAAREGMTALLANAEIVLEAKQAVTAGRPTFGSIGCELLQSVPGTTRMDPYAWEKIAFTYDVVANFGDAYGRVGTIRIVQKTTHYPRSPALEYLEAKFEPLPVGGIVR
ncbi:MAG: hypothetical protein JST04_08365 [Bdellovibrionales bacterium]|nr:hypothetical protein [Bdellovibrionales bacterium]